MALIKCPECGKEISDKAHACIHCGYPISEILDKIPQFVSNANNTPDIPAKEPTTSKAKSRSRPRWKSISIIVIIVIVLVIVISKFGNTRSQENAAPSKSGMSDEASIKIENEINFVTDFFYQKRAVVLSDHTDAVEDGSSIFIAGSFAGMNGEYCVCISDGEVYKVIFIRAEGEVVTEDVINEIQTYLGNYTEYDSKWNKYVWETDNLELSLYVDERIYFVPNDERKPDDTQEYEEDDNSNKKLTDSELETLAVQTLYSHLVSLESKYKTIDPDSCRYSINKIAHDDGSVEIYGIVYFYDKHGSVVKYGSHYQRNFTVHTTEWGSSAWCELQ